MKDRESAPTASLGPRPTHDGLGEQLEVDLDLDAYSEAEDGRMAMIGQLLIGKYLIEEVIGSGGVGVVYGGKHCELDRPVAIKVLAPLWATHGDAITRFEREARCLSVLGHPNVVDVYDFGRLEDGRPYLVMERLAGESLGRRLRRVKRLTIDETAVVLAQLASALDRVHELGVVHRDVKPDNVFMTTDHLGQETAKLLDFGLATAPTDRRLTQEGCVCGTPDYLAPEVANHAELDRSADIYALGVTLFEMLAGRVPFDGPSPWSILALKHAEPAPTLAAATRTRFPEEVERVVAKALERDPAKRHATAGELEADFRQAVAGFREEKTPLIHPVDTPAPQQTTPTPGPISLEVSSQDLRASLPKRRTGAWMLVGLAAFAAAIGAAWIAFSEQRADALPAITEPVAPEPAPLDEPAEAVAEPGLDLDPGPGALPILASAPPEGDANDAADLPAGVETPEPTLWSETPSQHPTGVARPRESTTHWSEPEPEPAPAVEPRPVEEAAPPPPARWTAPAPIAAETDPATYAALTREGYRRLARGELSLAVERFEAAGSRSAGALRGLGLAYERLGRREDAARAYQRYLDRVPGAPDRAAVEQRLEALR